MFIVKGWGAGLKNAGLPKKNKERVQDFGNLSRSWVDYHHSPKHQKCLALVKMRPIRV